jgi:hypothetical protein
MINGKPGQREEEGRAALTLMEQALELLDRCGTSLDAGAHLDLAICRLRERLQPGSGGMPDTDLSTCQQIDPEPLPWSKAS